MIGKWKFIFLSRHIYVNCIVNISLFLIGPAMKGSRRGWIKVKVLNYRLGWKGQPRWQVNEILSQYSTLIGH